jgi:hypothetical protein
MVNILCVLFVQFIIDAIYRKLQWCNESVIGDWNRDLQRPVQKCMDAEFQVCIENENESFRIDCDTTEEND